MACSGSRRHLPSLFYCVRSHTGGITNCWPRLREFARGRSSWIDHVVDVGARRLLAVARAGEVDEIVVVGHSAGGVAALALMARRSSSSPISAIADPSLCC
jgi:pimeloyl-ACP methyl ester carboxylesterase